MLDVAFIERFGLPVAFVIYLLWQQKRFIARAQTEYDRLAKRLGEVEESRIRDARAHAADFREVVDRVTCTEERILATLKDLARLMREHFQAPEPHDKSGETTALLPAFKDPATAPTKIMQNPTALTPRPSGRHRTPRN